MRTSPIPGTNYAAAGLPRSARPLRGPRLAHVLAAAIFLQILLILVFSSASFGAEPAAAKESAPAPTLVALRQPFQTSVPLVIARQSDGGVEVRKVGLKWNPSPAASPEAVRISVQRQEGDGWQVVESQAWIAAFSAAFVWQTPWQGAAWEIDHAPASDGSAVNAALAVAMIASASGTPFPADTVVIADLSPDGSLAPVPHMAARIEAAGAAGLKRIVIPAVERFEADSDGQRIDLAELAAKHGLACLPAATLAEAAGKILGARIAPDPQAGEAPPLDAAVFKQLDGECQAILAGLEKEKADWPTDADRQAALPLWQRALWGEALVRFENGVAFLRAGKVYAARGELGETKALVFALTALSGSIPSTPELSAEATSLAADYRASLGRVSGHAEELQNGLVMAEMADWAGMVVADLDGAQNLVYQTSGRRSDALPEQREMARLQLAMAVKKAEAKRERIASFAALHKLLVARNTVEVYDRAALWRPQLLPAHLALGESFVLRLQKADAQLAQNLIYDARLTEQTRLLRDQKEEWDTLHNAAATLQPAVAADGQEVGFSPGAAYRPPRTDALPSLRPAAFSDTEATMRWVNDYTEMALLYDRYFQFGGSYNPREMAWSFDDRAVLSGMLQSADFAARRGIAAARETGVDPTILELIYERALALRDSRLDTARMEALRQFWRCNLLGATAWQLAAIPKAEGVLRADAKPAAKPEAPGAVAAAAPAATIPTAPPVAVARAEAVTPAPAAAPVAKAVPVAAPSDTDDSDSEPELVPTRAATADEEIDHDEVRRATQVTLNAD
jgi:hypothetical protein